MNLLYPANQRNTLAGRPFLRNSCVESADTHQSIFLNPILLDYQDRSANTPFPCNLLGLSSYARRPALAFSESPVTLTLQVYFWGTVARFLCTWHALNSPHRNMLSPKPRAPYPWDPVGTLFFERAHKQNDSWT